jgi:hypothetical protein
MSRLMIISLQFFATLVTIEGIRNIIIAAIRTGFGYRLLFHPMPAAGTKLGAWCEIFAAGFTLIEHQLLMSALGTEFSVDRDRLMAVRAGNRLLFFLSLGLR